MPHCAHGILAFRPLAHFTLAIRNTADPTNARLSRLRSAVAGHLELRLIEGRRVHVSASAAVDLPREIAYALLEVTHPLLELEQLRI